jgi:aubergine
MSDKRRPDRTSHHDRGEKRGRERDRSDDSRSSSRRDEAGPSRRFDGPGPSRRYNDEAGLSRPRGKFSRGDRGGRGRGRGRGSGRGRGNGKAKREEFFDQIITRPETLDNKSGRARANDEGSDKDVELTANFFKLGEQKKSVTQYYVDFIPKVHIPGIRRSLIEQQNFGSFLFDGGSQIYLLNPLPQDTIVLGGRTRDGQEHTLKFKKTREVFYTEGAFLQVMNLVVRNAMQNLNLQLVGRHFYDAQAAVS